MGRIGFVELLDRRGRVRERVAITTLPATLGRGYANDVIIDDRFVSPVHGRIVRDGSGGLSLEDLGSVNGIATSEKGGARRRISIHSGDRFRLGETWLRFVDVRHPVAKAEPLSDKASGMRPFTRPRVAFGAVLAAALVLGLDAYFGTYYDLRFTAVSADVIAGLGALSLWAAAWAVSNRLVTHRFAYRSHLAWASLIVVATWAVGIVVDYSWFLLSAERFATTLDFVANGVLFGALLWGHLAILPAATPMRRASWARRSAFLFVLVSVLLAYGERDDFSTEVPVFVPLKSFGAEWAPAVTVEEFLSGARGTKDWVDAHAARRRESEREGGGGG